MSTIGNRFKEIRIEFNYNQKDFARELGISQNHISSIENGKDNPSSSLIKLVCLKFNVNEEWLTNGVGHWKDSVVKGFDVGTTEKYNEFRVIFEQALRNNAAEDTQNMIEAFSFFVSLVTNQKIKNDDKSNYIELIRQIIDDWERLVFKVSTYHLFPDARTDRQQEFKQYCSKQIDSIMQNIINSANTFLKDRDDLKLS